MGCNKLTFSLRSKFGSRKIAGTLDKLLEVEDFMGEEGLDWFAVDEILTVCLEQCFLSFRRYLSNVCSGKWHTKGDEGIGFSSVKSSPQLRVKKSFCLPIQKELVG